MENEKLKHVIQDGSYEMPLSFYQKVSLPSKRKAVISTDSVIPGTFSPGKNLEGMFEPAFNISYLDAPGPLPTEKTENVLIAPVVRSRHKTHNPLRKLLPKFPLSVVIRLGSTTPLKEKFAIQINSIQGIQASSNKLLMKKAFRDAGANTPVFSTYDFERCLSEDGLSIYFPQTDMFLKFPIIAKSIYGSRNKGNTMIKKWDDFLAWEKNRNYSNYIFEEFINYVREYRLHVSLVSGCFYTCRKMLKSETPEDQRWFRNDSNCVWIMEENPLFDKPLNFSNIVDECKSCLMTLRLDFAAFDVKVASGTDSEGRQVYKPRYIIIESNSAPSFGGVTLEKYLVELPKIINAKINRW